MKLQKYKILTKVAEAHDFSEHSGKIAIWDSLAAYKSMSSSQCYLGSIHCFWYMNSFSRHQIRVWWEIITMMKYPNYFLSRLFTKTANTSLALHSKTKVPWRQSYIHFGLPCILTFILNLLLGTEKVLKKYLLHKWVNIVSFGRER
jgi:hypothetical protein